VGVGPPLCLEHYFRSSTLPTQLSCHGIAKLHSKHSKCRAKCLGRCRRQRVISPLLVSARLPHRGSALKLRAALPSHSLISGLILQARSWLETGPPFLLQPLPLGLLLATPQTPDQLLPQIQQIQHQGHQRALQHLLHLR